MTDLGRFLVRPADDFLEEPADTGQGREKLQYLFANKIRNGTGSRLPSTQVRYTGQKDSPMAAPAGMPPRSSTIGSMDMQNR